jgi:hypothetical protein
MGAIAGKVEYKVQGQYEYWLIYRTMPGTSGTSDTGLRFNKKGKAREVCAALNAALRLGGKIGPQAS